MSIPFFRHIKYLDDGHELYQCLQCGQEIDAGGYYHYGLRFCAYCGVEYKGFVLPKKTDYISRPSYEVLWFQIEEAYDWGEGSEMNWSDNWRGCHSPQQAIKYMKDAYEEKKYFHKQDWDKFKFRISVRKKVKHHASVVIDTDKYYKKTGKKFDRKQYELVK